MDSNQCYKSLKAVMTSLDPDFGGKLTKFQKQLSLEECDHILETYKGRIFLYLKLNEKNKTLIDKEFEPEWEQFYNFGIDIEN